MVDIKKARDQPSAQKMEEDALKRLKDKYKKVTDTAAEATTDTSDPTKKPPKIPIFDDEAEG